MNERNITGQKDERKMKWIMVLQIYSFFKVFLNTTTTKDTLVNI